MKKIFLMLVIFSPALCGMNNTSTLQNTTIKATLLLEKKSPQAPLQITLNTAIPEHTYTFEYNPLVIHFTSQGISTLEYELKKHLHKICQQTSNANGFLMYNAHIQYQETEKQKINITGSLVCHTLGEGKKIVTLPYSQFLIDANKALQLFATFMAISNAQK